MFKLSLVEKHNLPYPFFLIYTLLICIVSQYTVFECLLASLLPSASVYCMNSCDALSPVAGFDMITWQSSNGAKSFKRLHTEKS